METQNMKSPSVLLQGGNKRTLHGLKLREYIQMLNRERKLSLVENEDRYLDDPYITTYTGGRFYYNHPEDADIRIEDIAHALSQLCRFTGHTKKFYSVAEHSCLVSEVCSKNNKLQGLLHDAAEAYTNDIATGLKKFIGIPYMEMQRKIELEVAKRFHLSFPFSEDVKDADRAQLKTEARHLLSSHEWVNEFTTKRRYGIVPLCLSPEAAKKLFLNRFNKLYGLV